MEEELWLLAALKVLKLAKKPLHYTEIKRIILDQGLLNPAMKTTLEEALFKEIQKAEERRFLSISGQPGVFGLVETTEIKEEPASEQVQRPHMSAPVSVYTRRVIRVRPSNPADSIALQEKYRLKYRRLRKQVKDLIFINSAVCDEVISIEDKIQKVKDERRYLLARLLQNRAVADSLLPPPPVTPAAPSGSTSKHTTQSIAQILGEVDRRKRKVQPALAAAGVKKRNPKDGAEERPKPKKARTGASGRRLVQPLPLDNLGRPMFPIDLGNLTIYCIGEIVPERSGFHSSDSIFPAGFCSTREYVSIRNPLEPCLYTCKIVDIGTGPKFDISPEDAPEIVFSGYSASECHLKLLKTINQGRGTELVPLTPRGEDFFGLSHPTVQNLIQSCPGAKKCGNYKWVRFEISKQPVPDTHDQDEPVLNVEALHKLPAFASLIKALQTPASLRTLLTTPEPS